MKPLARFPADGTQPRGKPMGKDSKSLKDKAGKADEPAKPPRRMPPEGPHARPDLTDHEKTPGTGSLPDSDTKGIDIGPG
jgi:hypothetical protein